MLHKFLINDLADTEHLAQHIAAVIVPNFVITLNGNLGSGKTTLTRYILQALGVRGVVKSPTFTLVEPYQLLDYTIYHFDLYRFSDPEEWFDAGFAEYFDQPHLCFIEWAEKAADLLPPIDWELILGLNQDHHQVTINAISATGKKCLSNLIQAAAV